MMIRALLLAIVTISGPAFADPDCNKYVKELTGYSLGPAEISLISSVAGFQPESAFSGTELFKDFYIFNYTTSRNQYDPTENLNSSRLSFFYYQNNITQIFISKAGKKPDVEKYFDEKLGVVQNAKDIVKTDSTVNASEGRNETTATFKCGSDISLIFEFREVTPELKIGVYSAMVTIDNDRKDRPTRSDVQSGCKDSISKVKYMLCQQ